MHYFSLGPGHVLVLLSILGSIIRASLAQGLSAPTLQATAFEGHRVALEWTDAESYSTNRIERKSGGSDWTLVAETGQGNSYWDRSTVAGVTYTYRVQAVTSQGLFTYSNEASATTEGPTLQPPGAPTLYAETVSHTAIRLRLNGIETGETYYILERNDPGGEWIEIASLGGLSTEYLDTGLTPAMYYPYRIRGWNHAGFSPYAYATATTFPDPIVIPSAPFLHAGERTDTSILLDWDYQPIASGYRIESKGPSGSWVEITNIPTATVTYIAHEGLLPATKYAYRMRAYNSSGISGYSAEASATTYTAPPSSPELRAVAISHSQIELRWTDVLTTCCTADGFIGYRLEILVGGDWRFLHFGGVDDTNYIVRGLQPATEYSFRITALHPLSSASSTATAKTMDAPPIPPSAPTFYADPFSSIAISLKWIDVELETEYRIERENFPGGGVWQQIAVVPANSTTYRDIDLQPGTLYVYRIRAANSYGTSAYSDEAAARTPPLPSFPLLAAGATSPTSVSLLVQPGEGAIHYQLQRLNRNGEWDVLYETNSAPFRFEDTGLTPFTPYTYRAASRLDRAPAWWYSAEVTAQTWPLEFTAFGRALSADSLELSWPYMPYAEHIYIRQLTNGVWASDPIELDGTATNYLITGLTPDSSYSYVIYAGNNVGGRSPEAQVTVRTPGSISGDIVINTIAPANNGADFRLRLTGSTGQKFKIQSTSDFESWADRTDALTLSENMEVEVPSVGTAAFYRTVKTN